MALLLFASFSSMNFSNLFTLSRICWDEKEVNVMSSLLLFFFLRYGGRLNAHKEGRYNIFT